VNKPTKVNLIEHFYEHLAEPDWLDGVDLYQAGRVNKIQIFEGLITGHVSSTDRAAAEVRVKIHPNGQYIQWIECTCKKNRQNGQYCEHIAAFMIHIDREKPDLFAKLDSKMPMKPPTPPSRARVQKSVIPGQERSIEKGVGAASTLLSHLKGSIHGVSLLAHGPAMRVRIEIKNGQLTHYDLDLDAAAKFLESHPDLENASQEVQRLSLFDQKVELGTRIQQADGEKIVAERCIILKSSKQVSAVRIQSELPNSLHYKKIGTTGETHESQWHFFSFKSAAKYVGKDYFFIPEVGYFPIQKESANPAWFDLPLTRTFKEDDAAEFILSRYAGYLGPASVWVDETLMTQVVVDAPKLSAVEILEDNNGWFRLDPKYGKGESTISMSLLMQHLRKKKRSFIRSGDVWLKIPDFVTQFPWQLAEDGEALKVDAIGIMRLKAAMGEFDQFAGSKAVINKLRERLDFDPDMPTPEMTASKLNLRSYQEIGLKWLWWLYRNGLHGLLADEMGLGKTHQAMALMTAIQKESPNAKFLVICPTTVLDHWLDKSFDFCPNLRPMKYHGSTRTGSFKKIENDSDLMITSYGVLLRDIKSLSAIPWKAVILDEAHFVKNHETATYQAVCRINSQIRICLTGTPMENDLSELKNIFDFLVPGYLGSNEYFKRIYMTPIAAGSAPEAELALQKLIYPFKMRRTKVQVLPELPAKVEDVRHCALSEEQVRLYREIVAMKANPLVQQLQDESTSIPYLHVFATISLLKQVCDHPALILDNADYKKHESGKFELLKELLREALESGHKVVIFTQYLGMVRIIQSYLEENGIGHEVLTGQTRNRGEVIARFQTLPDSKVFVGSLLAGGIGIDLTAASEVIHYDRWWNASKENQATDRVHRIGQEKNVQVLKLVTRGTLEEKIDTLIAAKAALFEKFMDKDEDVFKNLSRQELIDLLQ